MIDDGAFAKHLPRASRDAIRSGVHESLERISREEPLPEPESHRKHASYCPGKDRTPKITASATQSSVGCCPDLGRQEE